jgi:hypothetical protein
MVTPVTVTATAVPALSLAKVPVAVPPAETESTEYGLPSLVVPVPADSVASNAAVPPSGSVVVASYTLALAVDPVNVRAFAVIVAVVVGWVSV